MKRSLVLAALLSLSPVHAAEPPAAAGAPEQQLLDLSRAWMDAARGRDGARLEAILSPDFVLRSWDGTDVTPRAEWLDNTLHRLEISRFEFSTLSAKVFGEIGVVTSTYDWSGKFGPMAFESEKGFLTDVWVRKDGTWRVASRSADSMPTCPATPTRSEP